jgi:hypothetical protein
MMPIPSGPHTYRCPACHWSKTIAPQSDVLMPGIDHFDACPACWHHPLETQVAGAAQATLAGLTEKLYG